MKPVYTNTAAGVTAGQQVFQNVTDGTYASENTTVAVGTGDGTKVTFNATLAPAPVRPSTLTVTAGAVSGADNGTGMIVGTGVSGTIDYATGALSVKFTVAPANGVVVAAKYRYDSEQKIGRAHV